MKYADLESAFDFLDMGDPHDKAVYISRSTGEIHYSSDMADIDELSEDVEENDDDVELPNKYDLDLGKQLVWDFVDRQIPRLKQRVKSIFSRRGAYSRYKSFLEERDLLEAWYRFQEERTKRVLLEWCESEGIAIED
jgi:hypothetical protein